MQSSTSQVLPLQVRRGLAKLGADISIARRRRGLTTAMMAERIGVSRATYRKVEHGDPTVAISAYVMALFVLGFGTPMAGLLDSRTDQTGVLLETEHLPKRVRPKKDAQPK